MSVQPSTTAHLRAPHALDQLEQLRALAGGPSASRAISEPSSVRSAADGSIISTP
jgi:hypothetical protein